jgi:hypothetical protein
MPPNDEIAMVRSEDRQKIEEIIACLRKTG